MLNYRPSVTLRNPSVAARSRAVGVPPEFKCKCPTAHAISVWLMNLLLPYGGFGLMLLAVCDSSFLSLPEVNDILLMTFFAERSGRYVEVRDVYHAGFSDRLCRCCTP